MKSLIIAHRGASKYAPENTMPAFRLAYEMGADGIETDVQLTKDSVPILIHDEDLKRTTNQSGLIKDTLLSALEKIDAGYLFPDKFINTKIPTLEELLIWAKNKPLQLHLELKTKATVNQGLEKTVFDMVKKHQMQNQVIYSSFNQESIKRLRALDHQIEIALLTAKQADNLLDIATQCGANALHLEHSLLHGKLVTQCQEAHFPYRVYTVNHPEAIQRSLRYLSHGIMTDVPDRAIDIRQLFAHND